MQISWRSRESLIKSNTLPESNLAESPFPDLIKRFLNVRGFHDLEKTQEFIHPKLSQLKNPLSIQGMSVAVERLVEAFKQQEKVCLYADFDLDGTSGLALMFEGFQRLGFHNTICYQPKRLSEGYGFHSHVVEDLRQQNVSLIVTIDVGITALKACDKAKELGIDVIITDHHQVGEMLPSAHTIVNPNLPTDQSGLGYLCGAGVGFYLLRALKRALVDQKLAKDEQFDLRSVLDCFCIATVTDMVPLIEDNRVLVKAGLAQLEVTKRPGLQSLLKALDMDGKKLTSQDVGIRFAPKLNALSRMEMGIFPIDLYLVQDPIQAEQMVKTVLQNNSTRVQLQSDADAEAQEQLKSWQQDHFVLAASENFHKGVVGLIATKLALNTHLPAFVGSINSEGIMTGSARLPSGSSDSLVEALQACSHVLQRFGGHAAAAGFELLAHRKQEFIQALMNYYQGREKINTKIVEYDIDVDLASINENLMKWFESLGPYGQGFQQPLLCFKQIEVQEALILKSSHLKLKLKNPRDNQKLEAIYFSAPTEILSQFSSHKSLVIDLLGELQWNYFAGRKNIQIMIKEIMIKRQNESTNTQ